MSAESEARALVALYDQRVRMTADLAASDHPTGTMADAVMAVGRELEDACEAYRAKYHPRAGRVFVGLYAVCVSSPARKVTTVLDLFDEYRGGRR